MTHYSWDTCPSVKSNKEGKICKECVFQQPHVLSSEPLELTQWVSKSLVLWTWQWYMGLTLICPAGAAPQLPMQEPGDYRRYRPSGQGQEPNKVRNWSCASRLKVSPLSCLLFFSPTPLFIRVSCRPIWPWTLCVAQDDIELLPLSFQCWDYRCTPPHGYIHKCVPPCLFSLSELVSSSPRVRSNSSYPWAWVRRALESKPKFYASLICGLNEIFVTEFQRGGSHLWVPVHTYMYI